MRHVFLESAGLSASRGQVINSSRDCHKEISTLGSANMLG